MLFVAGVAGGLVSLAFLVGVLIVEPLAFFILVALAALVWHLAGRPWTSGRGRPGPDGSTTREEPVYDDEDFLGALDRTTIVGPSTTS